MGSCEGNNKEVKFGVDAMLGKLAKILRFYGFDTKYFKNEKDIEIVALCLREDRILITSDTDLNRLAKAWNVKTIYIDANEKKDPWDLAEYIISKSEGKPKPFTICPKCNGKLKIVSKWDIEGFVHPFVWNKFEEFAVCEECGQIYWEGTHYQKIIKKLKL